MPTQDAQRIPLAEPFLTGNARAYLEQCLATNYVSSVGPFVERFEREFAAYVGARHAVACASGTAAIHVALRLLGLARGDEVFVSTLTFVASANPIVYECATPVLVDSERETWNLDPELVVEELERRARAGLRQPRAVEAVHVLGHPARLDALAAACERHGVVLIEDAAEALGAGYLGGALAGRQAGTIGRVGCFSFNGNKVITTGGGGMAVTDDPELARRLKHLTTQARLPGREYRHDVVGFNYRLSNLAAALGVAQLEQLDVFLDRKRAIAERYDQALAEIQGLTPAPHAPWARPSHWLHSIRIDPERLGCGRDALIDSLAAAGIEARPIWTPLHLLPVYASAPRLGDGSVAESLFRSSLSLPSSVQLRPEQQQRVIEQLYGCVGGRRPA